MEGLAPRLVKLSETTISRLMMPPDANLAGNVFGGTILKMIDEVAFLAASKHTGRNAVTASIDRMDFFEPVYIGDVLTLRSSVNFVGKSSMEVGVSIEASNPITRKTRKTGHCYLVYVALDDKGHPVEVPEVIPQTAVERRRYREAKERRRRRLAEARR